ncbi:isocitrate/isopropylmalate dehydrogenase family protein [Brucella pituitosa]|uniref:isocitrate/isopropylmalate dehydrogenase family protein n=1 Tax=Brucella pituitosa TaxID=571256 RepID=UPI0020065796|nr:isocitrate/isopropylmalate dehydrogenase family protein [Brucella pituitosa]MCK4207111.1 isocitrate/isopropylmalate dehydrogenase family protein [Brucella pituitosa]
MTNARKSVSFLVLKGDGIGPEICDATILVLNSLAERLDFEISFESAAIGFEALRQQGTTFPDYILDKARKVDGIILGPVSHNEYPPLASGGLNPSGELRKKLDLYANLRPALTYENLAAPARKPFDLLIVRENTEGFYADRSMFSGPGEMMPTPDLAIAFRKISRQSCMRIAETAFAQAKLRRRKVTAVHKANVLRVSDGLFLECARLIASRHPDIEYEEQLVDAMAALLIRDASAFDVIVTTNMYGDILSDEASELSGGLGLAASLNLGEGIAVAQAQHGSAPSLAGTGRANPTSLILSAAMLLEWLGEKTQVSAYSRGAKMITDAVKAALSAPEMRTGDIEGPLSTQEFADNLSRMIRHPST